MKYSPVLETIIGTGIYTPDIDSSKDFTGKRVITWHTRTNKWLRQWMKTDEPTFKSKGLKIWQLEIDALGG